MTSGRLTLDQANAFPLGDVTGSTLFYVPTPAGCAAPLVMDSGEVVPVPFTSSHLDRGPSFSLNGLSAGSAHDIYLAYVSGAPLLVRVPWAGTPLAPQVADASYDGLPVNAVAMTAYRGEGSAVPIPQYHGLHLGSVDISAPGLAKCLSSYGEARQWGVWNRHNQQKILLKGGSLRAGVTNDTYMYSPAWAPFLGNMEAHLRIFSGRPVGVDIWYHAAAWLQAYAGSNSIIQGAIGWNSTTTPSGVWWQRDIEGYGGGNYPQYFAETYLANQTNTAARFVQNVSNGQNKAYALIKTQDIADASVGNDGTSVAVMWGEELRMLMTAEWWG